MPGDSLSVPAQQSLRRDEPPASLQSGQGRRYASKQGPVLIGRLRPVVVAAQYRQLVTQHDDLEFLRAPATDRQPCKQHQESIEDATHEVQDGAPSALFCAHGRVLGTHKLWGRSKGRASGCQPGSDRSAPGPLFRALSHRAMPRQGLPRLAVPCLPCLACHAWSRVAVPGLAMSGLCRPWSECSRVG